MDAQTKSTLEIVVDTIRSEQLMTEEELRKFFDIVAMRILKRDIPPIIEKDFR